MPVPSVFEYAIIRVVPRVERGECINVGVVLFARTRRFLGAQIALDERRLQAFAPTLDIAAVAEQLRLIEPLCRGGRAAGPIGELSQAERFRWLIAPRSTIVQPSPVHCGLTDDPAASLAHLAATLVL
jgi:hypothetical protein